MEGARNDAALEILEEKGFEIGTAVVHEDGCVQIAVSSKDDSAMIEVGQELWDFAAGLVTLSEINAHQKVVILAPGFHAELSKRRSSPR